MSSQLITTIQVITRCHLVVLLSSFYTSQSNEIYFPGWGFFIPLFYFLVSLSCTRGTANQSQTTQSELQSYSWILFAIFSVQLLFIEHTMNMLQHFFGFVYLSAVSQLVSLIGLYVLFVQTTELTLNDAINLFGD